MDRAKPSADRRLLGRLAGDRRGAPAAAAAAGNEGREDRGGDAALTMKFALVTCPLRLAGGRSSTSLAWPRTVSGPGDLGGDFVLSHRDLWSQPSSARSWYERRIRLLPFARQRLCVHCIAPVARKMAQSRTISGARLRGRIDRLGLTYSAAAPPLGLPTTVCKSRCAGIAVSAVRPRSSSATSNTGRASSATDGRANCHSNGKRGVTGGSPIPLPVRSPDRK